MDLGTRLRFVRMARNLSQRELAKRTGVTNSTISLIESGDMNPSVGTLKRILDGVPVTLGEFFSIAPEGAEKIFHRSDDLVAFEQGGVTFRQVGAPQFGSSLQILREIYAPGADTGTAVYAHEGEEGGFIVRGEVEITVGQKSEVLGPGDAYHFDSRQPHRFRCVSPEGCEIVSACTPPTF
ncbi:cupin domain-containing protein [Gluconobacter kanchanaburiensis]|uniref:Aldehyde dehydrogenase n=1 Tax=Gluconobacter kanchanaburiensis NBRC 103587 TaxID=1307948 RepID=A0A511BBP4_9PROT|nr:cupin domain-containing protein [Gluconobacter kanchanaburiensis]MBF0861612.1 cupin domain-containing protein [Gluconobacter kanchanaburiensis]GBR67087.1 aldehyde dehydrogenase [Gluconobacter kanchanaburiensis NBRC 103587]GEK95257.1 aldehyde dehydrogenase [Gluconobacter kanchanaburiensis NBRC 103587]